MTEEYEFNIHEKTLEKILSLKNQMGFSEKNWDEWFNEIISQSKGVGREQSVIERAFEKNHYKKNYESWINHFALNLNDIWNELSARELDPSLDINFKPLNNSAIVIGRGPSLKLHNHLEILAKSDYKGAIVCTDGALELVLKGLGTRLQI